MPAAVEGHCDPRFEPLRDAFRANFAERGELGAAVCVMVDNNVVADLCGGWADQEQRRPWQQDTLVNVFSVGKGLVAACTTNALPRSYGKACLPRKRNHQTWTLPAVYESLAR